LTSPFACSFEVKGRSEASKVALEVLELAIGEIRFVPLVASLLLSSCLSLLLHFWKHLEKSISYERANLEVGCQRLSLAEIVQQIIFGMISARDYLWQWLL